MSELTVGVLAGRGLAPKDRTGLSDPYVILEVRGTKRDNAKTLVKGQTLNPEWNETFSFSVAGDELLYLECWDWDQFSKDDFMGCCHINPWQNSSFMKTGSSKAWYPLSTGRGLGKQGIVSGEIQISLSTKQLPSLKRSTKTGPISNQAESKSGTPVGEVESTGLVEGIALKVNIPGFAQLRCSPTVLLSFPIATIVKEAEVAVAKHIGIDPTSRKLQSYHLYLGFGRIGSRRLKEGKTLRKYVEKFATLTYQYRQGMEVVYRRSKKASRNQAIELTVTPVEENRVPYALRLSNSKVTANEALEKLVRDVALQRSSHCSLYLAMPHGQDTTRTIRLDPTWSLIRYLLDDGDHLLLECSPSFQSFEEKFGMKRFSVSEGIYFLCLHCARQPIPLRPIPNGQESFIEALAPSLLVTSQRAAEIREIFDAGSGTESLLKELQWRCQQKFNHPFYTSAAFKSKDEYQRWIEAETREVIQHSCKIVFQRENYYGLLFLKEIRAENVPGKDASGLSDPYIVFESDFQKHVTKKKRRTLNPAWKEEFSLDVLSIYEPIKLTMMDWDALSEDDYMGSAQLKLSDNVVNLDGKWHKLSLPMETSGTIHLQYQLRQSFEEYLSESASQCTPEKSASTSSKEMCDHHANYNSLFAALVPKDLTAGVLLGEQGDWLLEQYGCRFGVHRPYRQLLDVQHILQHFQPKKPIIDALADMMCYLDRPDIPIIAAEEASLSRVRNSLLDIAVENLDHFIDLFPKNEPTGCVATLIDFVRQCLRFQKNEKTLTEVLSGCIKDAARNAYVKSGVVNMDEEPSFDLISKADCIEDVLGSINTYLNTFPRDLGIVGIVVVTLHELLKEDVQSLLAIPNSKIEAYDLFMRLKSTRLAVMDRMDDKFEFMPLEEMFKGAIYMWLKGLPGTMIPWVRQALELDQRNSISDSNLHSSAVVDVFSAATSAMAKVRDMKLGDAFIFVELGEVLCKIITEYMFAERERGIACVEQQMGNATTSPFNLLRLKPGDSGSAPSFQITKEMCIVLNNLERAPHMFTNLAEELESDLDGFKDVSDRVFVCKQSLERILNDVFGLMKQQSESVIESIVIVLGKVIADTFSAYVKSVLESGVTELAVKEHPAQLVANYLDEKLGDLPGKIYPNVLKYLLGALWTDTMEALRAAVIGFRPEEYVKNHKNLLSKGQHVLHGWLKDIRWAVAREMEVCGVKPALASILAQSVGLLMEYFHGDGSGISMNSLQKSEEYLHTKRLLEILQMSTQELIELHRKVSLEGVKDISGVTMREMNAIIAGRKQKGDIMAQAFQKEQVKGKGKSEELRNLYGLSKNELILQSHNCLHHKTPGKLRLTTGHLIFASAFSSEMEDAMIIPLSDIVSVFKTKVAVVFDAVAVNTNQGQSQTFSHFGLKNVKRIVADIIEQAKRSGNSRL